MLLKSTEELREVVQKTRQAGKTISVCNGTFDLLHAGHLWLIKQSKEAADELIVLINSDASVKRYKGKTRPIVSETDRAELLSALGDVSYVYIFNEDTPIPTLEIIRPNVYITGPDYGDKCIEKETVVDYGGKVITAKRKTGVLSTSEIIGKILKIEKDSTKAIFLDRDGVINKDTGYVGKLKDFNFIEGSAKAIADLHKAGWKIFIISNQSGVARGYFTEEDVKTITEHIGNEINKYGGNIEEVFYCFHGPDDNCICRKPNPTVLKKIIDKYSLTTRDCYFISDTKNDLQMAKLLNIKTIWINNNPSHPKNNVVLIPDHTVNTLKKASKIILGQ